MFVRATIRLVIGPPSWDTGEILVENRKLQMLPAPSAYSAPDISVRFNCFSIFLFPAVATSLLLHL